VLLIDVVLVKSDPIIKQSSIRAEQITKSLVKKYSVISLGWDRGFTQIDYESINRLRYVKLFNLKAPYAFQRFGKIRLIIYFPIFWTWIFVKLCEYRPRIVHACDLATISPCYLYKIIFGKKLIFDVLDRYGMTYVSNKKNSFFKILHLLVNKVEEFYASKSDMLITVSDNMLLTFRKRPKNSVTIMNCPNDSLPDKPRAEVSGYRLLYTGAIRQGRGLEILCDLLNDLEDTELIITGKVKDLKLKNEIDRITNIKYHGFFDRNELLELESSCHVMVALYDLQLQSQYEYGVANKVLEAMMCGVAVITNISHDLVNETKCGILVDYGNIPEIKQAIIKLRDNPQLRKLYATNGRKAFLKKYNWRKMEEKLYNKYDTLLNKYHLDE
jgi:glycosyltransferase involved in cell wall biosynthesis